MPESEKQTTPFQIFRHSTAPSLQEANCMTIEPFAEKLLPSIGKAFESGMQDGDQLRVLFNVPGFSLVHVWFKAHYPLPLHSHDADCLYYIIAGSISLGTEELGPRDGFFIPAGVPYTYKPGPDGVELLEFRHSTQFNFVNLASNPAFWVKAAETATANRELWKEAKMPALNVS